MGRLGTFALFPFGFQIKAKPRFAFNAAELGFNDSNGVVDFLVLLTDDGEGLNNSTDILIDQEAQVVGHEVAVVDPHIVVVSQQACMGNCAFVTCHSEGRADIVQR